MNSPAAVLVAGAGVPDMGDVNHLVRWHPGYLSATSPSRHFLAQGRVVQPEAHFPLWALHHTPVPVSDPAIVGVSQLPRYVGLHAYTQWHVQPECREG